MMSASACKFSRSNTIFDDISVPVPNLSLKHKPIQLNKKTSHIAFKKPPTPTSSASVQPYESVVDIFDRRLRALKKRMQRVEKNEEVLLAYNLENRKLSKIKGFTPKPIPLNPDQLKAIENKSHLAELISEIDHLSTLVNSYASSNPEAPKHTPPVTSTVVSQEETPSMTNSPTGRDVLELWAAFFRINSSSISTLPQQDLLEVQSAFSIIQSVLDNSEPQDGIDSIISWMNRTPANEETTHERDVFSYGPSYVLIKHHIKKLLAPPIILPKGTSSNKNNFLKKFVPNEENSKFKSLNTDFPLIETPVEQWNQLPELDSAIVRTSALPVETKSATSNTGEIQFILKKITHSKDKPINDISIRRHFSPKDKRPNSIATKKKQNLKSV